jgi:predicted RNase H-like HicB family nuclease
MEAVVERKPLEYYLSLKYPVTFYPDPEGGYVVEIEDLPGCISQGETLEEAVEMIEDARRCWLEVAYEEGMNIPLPRSEEEYSGKFFIRAPKSLHRKLVRMAQREGVSLNQFLVATLAGAVGRDEALREKKGK